MLNAIILIFTLNFFYYFLNIKVRNSYLFFQKIKVRNSYFIFYKNKKLISFSINIVGTIFIIITIIATTTISSLKWNTWQKIKKPGELGGRRPQRLPWEERRASDKVVNPEITAGPFLVDCPGAGCSPVWIGKVALLRWPADVCVWLTLAYCPGLGWDQCQAGGPLLHRRPVRDCCFGALASSVPRLQIVTRMAMAFPGWFYNITRGSSRSVGKEGWTEGMVEHKKDAETAVGSSVRGRVNKH